MRQAITAQVKYVVSMHKFSKCCVTPNGRPEAKTDLTHGRGEFRNWICHHCNAHVYRNDFYTGEQWENWMNSDSHDREYDFLENITEGNKQCMTTQQHRL